MKPYLKAPSEAQMHELRMLGLNEPQSSDTLVLSCPRGPDTMICSVETQGPTWAKRLVQYTMDNQSFQKSAVKGWSRAERLNLLLKRLFVLQIVGHFLLCFSWV
jgi:hypothetical protein